MNDPAVIRRLNIRGRVQGIGYRAWAEYAAMERDIAGWVRNRRDGTVEVVIAGPLDAVTAMIAACRKGPPGARVDGIEESDADPSDLKLRRPGEKFSQIATL
jgi:acylphosphatase